MSSGMSSGNVEWDHSTKMSSGSQALHTYIQKPVVYWDIRFLYYRSRFCIGTVDSFTTEAIVYWDNQFLYYRSDCVIQNVHLGTS